MLYFNELSEDERDHSVYRQPIDRRAVLMSSIGLVAAAIWNIPGDGAAAASEFADSNFYSSLTFAYSFLV